jgi:hypothetical protein
MQLLDFVLAESRLLAKTLSARIGKSALRRAGEFRREIIFLLGMLFILHLNSPLQHGI